MSYPRSTFQRSDSQSGLYAHTQQQQSAANQGQQRQPNQQSQHSSSSRPRFESRLPSDSTTTQSPLFEFYGDAFDDDWEDQQLDQAKFTVRQIKVQIRSICDNRDANIDNVIALLEQIKEAQTQSDLRCVRAYEPGLLESLSDPLYQLIKKLDIDLQSNEKLVESLNAEDIHTIFNGLSAIVGESVNDSLLLRPHFNKLQQSLRDITETLLTHVVDQGLLHKYWDSSSLINAFNWVSRGLKKNILSAQSPVLREAFTQALMMMKDWASSAGGTATTLIAPLDTRQLGKCMVQVATARKYGLVTEKAPDHLLRDVVLGLCGGKALDRCMLWQKGTNNSQHARLLTPVMPDGVEITNISNAVKDCLKFGILRLEDKPVQSVINKLCQQINLIPEANLLERQGQRLGNCGNFLREIFEREHAAAQPVLQDRAAYEKACKHLLDQVLKISPVVSLSAQSIANLFSFVKAMDRTRRHPTEILRAAASVLVRQLQTMREEMTDADSIAATLGGLQHLALRGLTPRGIAANQMLSLINEIDSKDLPTWPENSRAALMQAAVHCWHDLSARTTHPPREALLAVMRQLLDLPATEIDRYACLMAADVLIGQDAAWLSKHQSLLSQLLPAKAGRVIREGDVLQALVQLRASEPVIEKLPESQTSAGPDQNLLAAPSMAATTSPAISPSGAGKPITSRLPVGMTRVVEPLKKNTTKTTTTTTTTNTTTTTTTTTTTKPVSALVNTPADSWRSPSRVAKAKPRDIPVLTSSEPKLLARDKPAAEKREVTAKKANPEKTRPSVADKGQGKPIKKASPAINKTKQTPEQAWFHLLKQEGALSASQRQQLQALLKATPQLAVSAEGKGSKARSALFYALSTGKAEEVSLIMQANAQVRRDIAGTLRQVFEEVLIVGKSEASALKNCLSVLSASELARLREALNQHYPPGEMQKRIARGLLEVLSEKGLVRQESVVIENRLDSLNSAKATEKTMRDQLVTPENSALHPVDSVDDDGFNALMIAAENGNTDEFRSLMLHESGLQQMKAESKTGWNALMLAAYGGHADIVQLIVSHPLFVEQIGVTDVSVLNALMIAAERGHAAVVKILIEHDSQSENLKTINQQGCNALMIASQHGHADVVKLLIENDSGVEQMKVVDALGGNALMIAAKDGHAAVVDVLIHHESGLEQIRNTDVGGWNALMVAVKEGHTAVVKLLLGHESGGEQLALTNRLELNALITAVINRNTDIVELLVRHDSADEQIKFISQDGMNALIVAAEIGNLAAVKLLVEHGLCVEQMRVVGKTGKNALMHAAMKGYVAIVKLLMGHESSKAQLNVVNSEQCNALMLAASYGHTAVVELLLSKDPEGEQLMTSQTVGLNALMLATVFGKIDVVKILIRHDSVERQLRARNSLGMDALQLALIKGHGAIVDLLESVM